MPPQSRGAPPKPLPLPAGFQSKSTPNLPTLRALRARPTPSASPAIITAPDAPPSPDAFSLDPPSLSSNDDDADDASSGEEDARAPPNNLPTPRPIHHHHSRSHTYLAPSAFAPPFYNRPPTPLPPSPSLTSLLRPNFSSANSRPSTPDPSSDEGGHPTHPPPHSHTNGTLTPASASTTPTLLTPTAPTSAVPRASPQVPTYEYYGFTLYLTSSLTFLAYTLWAYLPSPFLHQLGIYYYPNRWWALAVPAWFMMLVAYTYVALASYNTGYLTLALSSVECLVDEAGNVAVVDEKGRLVRRERASWQVEVSGAGAGKRAVSGGGGGGGGGAKGGRREQRPGHSRQGSSSRMPLAEPELEWRELWNEGTDAVMDIPIGGVCEILYGGRSGDDDDDEG
ncbi:hypothetical protein LTR08_008106 [Meristemomyces frigidus]|nr:hypothetical protein LTR08_008106 [Meristemomyces frigidus]